HQLNSLSRQDFGTVQPWSRRCLAKADRGTGGEDFVLGHYCPAPSKMTIQEFPSMTSLAAQERVKHLKKRLLSWDFHPHDLSEDDLMRCVVVVVEEVMKLDGLGDLNIPEHLLHRFVIGLRDSYHRSNPYHNFAHAVDVLQAAFYFLCRMGKLPLTGTGYPPLTRANGCDTDAQESQSTEPSTSIPTTTTTTTTTTITTTADDTSSMEGDTPSPLCVQDFLRPEDIFALIVASIGHDVGHPGVNNMFLINAHTPLAQVYNDRSVLESFHSMALFQVMKKHGFECFDVDSQNRKFMEFRKMVVSTILATDMGLHFDYVGKIKEQTDRLRLRALPGGDVPKPNQANIDDQERLLLCGTLIKCADISNASRPFHVAERWSTVLLKEMCNQADIENEMAVCSGAPAVPAGSTKSLATDRGMQIDSQLGFIHGFAMPLFKMGYCVEFLQSNHKIWQERKTEYLKNGGGSFTIPINHVRPPPMEDEELEQRDPPSPRRNLNYNKPKGLNGKLPQSSLNSKQVLKPPVRRPQQGSELVDGERLVSQMTLPTKVQTSNIRRSNIPNISNGSASPAEATSPSTALPTRPRLTRTKALSSDGNVGPGTYGQDNRGAGQQQQQQQQPQQQPQHKQRGRLNNLQEI
ncbi:3',5'-cyclic-nucleotide phosphodiesterase, partial [Modicella reniformis]